LHVSDLPIGDISYEVGYENPETFTRRFKIMFGVSPEKFRKKKNISSLLEIKSHDPKRLKVVQMNTEFMGRLEMKNDVSLISVRHKGPFQKLNKSWKSFVQMIQKQKKLTKEDQFYGIVGSNPDVSQEEEMTFDLCYETIQPSFLEMTGVHSKKINQGSYAVFRYKGEFQYFDILYPYIYKTLLGSENIRLRDGILFEKYIQNPIFFSQKNCITDIYIPVE
jgi:AraC family transcriptional regulator